MAITVREALKLGKFKRGKLLAGERNLDNKIKYVDAMEVPNIEKWLRKYELLITTGHAIKNDVNKLKELIRYMAFNEMAGFAIKPSQSFGGKIPQEVIDLAEELGLPLIEIPEDLAFIDITHPILKAIQGRQGRQLEFLNRVHNALLEVEIKEKGLREITETTKNLFSNDVLIIDRYLRVITAATVDNTDDLAICQGEHINLPESIKKAISRVNLTKKLDANKEWKIWVRDIKGNNETFGYIIITERFKKLTDIEVKAIEHVTSIVTLEFLKQRTGFQDFQRIQNDFLDDLIEGNYKDFSLTEKQARTYGWPVDSSMFLSITEVEGLQGGIYSSEGNDQYFINGIYNVIKRVLKEQGFSRKTVISRSDSFLTLISEKEATGKEKIITLFEEIQARVKRDFGIVLTTAVSGPDYGLKNMLKNYKNTRDAITIGKKVLGSGYCGHIDQLVFFRVLYKYPERDELMRFYDYTIGKLEDYDRKNNTDLVRILKAYMDNLGTITEAAREVYVHRNTMKNKIEKIEKLLGIDLKESEAFFKILLAFKIRNLFI